MSRDQETGPGSSVISNRVTIVKFIHFLDWSEGPFCPTVSVAHTRCPDPPLLGPLLTCRLSPVALLREGWRTDLPWRDIPYAGQQDQMSTSTGPDIESVLSKSYINCHHHYLSYK